MKYVRERAARFFALYVRPVDVIRDLALLAVFSTLAGLGGRWFWFLDLFTHFPLQYLLALAPAVVLLAVLRRPRAAAVCAACALFNVWQLVPYYAPPAEPPPAQAARLRVMEINVLRENGHGDQALRAIRDAQADLVLAMEVTPAWMTKLDALRDVYPYVVEEPQEDCFGIVLFSRWPVREQHTLWLGYGWVPSLRATVDVDGRLIEVVGTHPVPPVGKDRWDARNDQLQDLAREAAGRDHPLVMIGDLNVTPWSPHFRALLRDGNLADSARGHGVRAAWPSFAPALLRIPIDHVLVSPEFRVLDRRVGAPFGSDHLPLIVELAL